MSKQSEKEMVVDCTVSIDQAMQAAGGAVSSHVLGMSVKEFIAEVAAQNNIRFVYLEHARDENVATD